MKEIINFSTKFESLEVVNPLITKYRINICVPDKPANKYIFSKSVIEGMSNTIMGAGVYAYYFDKENQLGGHEDDIVKTSHGYKITGEPVAYGFSDPYKKPYWITKDGEEWYTADVFLWTGRNPHIEETLNNPVWQSMEVCLDNDEDKYGNKIVTEAVFLGFCLLQGISPAFTGSTIEKFSLPSITSEIDLLKQEYEQFTSKYDSLDFTIPSSVKESTKLGLELYKKYSKGGTSVSLANARFIQKNDIITPQKIKNISKYSSRIISKDFSEDDESDSNWISFNLWGASEGYKWSNKLVEEMNKKDEERMSYFVINNETIVKESNSEIIDNIDISTKEFSEINKEGENVIKEAVEKFSLTSSQIHEILNNAFSEYKYGDSWRKYWVNCYDDIYVYVEDSEECKTYRYTYDISDNVAILDMNSKEEVIRGGYIPVGEKLENMSAENMTEDKDKEDFKSDVEDEGKENKEDTKTDVKNEIEENKEDMSSNENVDNTAMQELNDKAAEDNKELSDEQVKVEDDKDKIIVGLTSDMNAIQEKLSKIETDMTVYMDENTKLKEFKASIEKQNKEFEVELTLKDVMSVLPQEEIDACRMSSIEFSLDNISVWKNEVQAKAFKFSKGITEKKSYIQIANPITNKPKSNTGLWD